MQQTVTKVTRTSTVVRVAKRLQLAGVLLVLIPPLVAAAIDVVFYREGLFLFVMASYIFAGPGILVGIVGLLLEAFGRLKQ